MNRAASIALTPLSVLYGLGVGIRNGLYRGGVRRSFDVGAPVISVGNLTAGGTGKTPLVEIIAARMATQGLRVCVLTRGYGRNSSGRVVVSDHNRVLSDVNEAGDEPFLLAENLRGRAAVICDKNRVAAAQWAIEKLGAQLFVLDDAFQHQQIRREANVLTLDATNAFGNGKLLPAGILREGIKEIARADCVVITRADESEELEDLRARIQKVAGDVPIFTSTIKLGEVRSVDRKGQVEDITKVPLAAFCGIGNPASFLTLLRRESHELIYVRDYPDHHRYTQTDVNQLTREAAARGAQALVTTTKDAVKLRAFDFQLPCYVVATSVQIEPPEIFFRRLTELIQR